MISFPTDTSDRLAKLEASLSSIEPRLEFVENQLREFLITLPRLKHDLSNAWLTAGGAERVVETLRTELLDFRQEAAGRAEERRMQIAADDTRRIERQRESDRRFWVHMAVSALAAFLAIIAWKRR